MTVPTLDPAEAKTLLEFLMDLLTDDDAREAFEHDPQKALDAAGLGDVTLEEIKELFPVVLERCDPHKCADYEDECDRYEGPCPPAHCPPHLQHCDDRPAHHDVEVDKVITHLNYVCNNYSFDSHDTIFNNNVSIVNLGDGDVDFDQDIDFRPVHAGDGSTVVQGDNNTVQHGGTNVIGDDNQVAGHNGAFGDGSTAFDGFSAGDASAVNFGSGSATSTQDNHHESTEVNGENNNVGSGAQTNTDSSVHDNPVIIKDSGNTDHSGDTTTEDNSDHSTDNSVSHHGSDNIDNSQQDNSGLHLPVL